MRKLLVVPIPKGARPTRYEDKLKVDELVRILGSLPVAGKLTLTADGLAVWV